MRGCHLLEELGVEDFTLHFTCMEERDLPNLDGRADDTLLTCFPVRKLLQMSCGGVSVVAPREVGFSGLTQCSFRLSKVNLKLEVPCYAAK